MSRVSGNPIPTDKIVSRLRLMAGAGGMLTRDRLMTVTLAADRLEDLEKRVAMRTQSMKTLIAIPCMETVHADFAKSLVDLTRNAPEETYVCFKKSSLIYDSRNLLSLTAIEGNYDRVLWLDSDMVFTPDTMLSLHKDMDETEADIITGLYVKRNPSALPVLYKTIRPPEKNDNSIAKCVEDYLDYPQDEIFPVAGAGFGCVMMSVPLLQKLWNDYGPPFSPVVWAGEDISFFYRANMAGAKILCDSRIRLGHVGNVVFTPDFYTANRNKTR